MRKRLRIRLGVAAIVLSVLFGSIELWSYMAGRALGYGYVWHAFIWDEYYVYLHEDRGRCSFGLARRGKLPSRYMKGWDRDDWRPDIWPIPDTVVNRPTAGLNKFNFRGLLAITAGTPRLGLHSWFRGFVVPAGSLPITALMVGAILIISPRLRRRIRPGYCASCGYDVRGNDSGVCSECGTRFSGVTMVPSAQETVIDNENNR